MSEKPSILILEDNDFVRMQMNQFLQSGGHQTCLASSATEGLAHLEKENISGALVDVRMEPEDGFDFINKIQAMDIHVPCILVTGDNNNDILAKATDLGVVSVLMKPVDKDRLLKMVDRFFA